VVTKRRKATQDLYNDFFERLTYPKLGDLKVAQMRFSDIALLHYRLRNTPITADRVIAASSTLFSWCERCGFRPRYSNPVQGVERFEEKSKERFLSPRELARLGIALARAERNQTESVYVIAAIRLLMLTGCRRNQILELQWKDISIDRAMLLLPETKTGARPVYLSAPALSVLASLPRLRNSPYVIVGEKDGQHLINLRKPWLRICKVARLKDVRIHDLRHSSMSIGVSGGASLLMIGKLLGHTKSSTTEKYSHLAADPVRAVNEAMGQQIAAMLKGHKGNVVRLLPRGDPMEHGGKGNTSPCIARQIECRMHIEVHELLTLCAFNRNCFGLLDGCRQELGGVLRNEKIDLPMAEQRHGQLIGFMGDHHDVAGAIGFLCCLGQSRMTAGHEIDGSNAGVGFQHLLCGGAGGG
jgi:integrase